VRAAALAILAAALAAPATLAAGCGGSGTPSSATEHRTAPNGAPRRDTPPAHRSLAALHLPANAPSRAVRVPILMYHRVHAYATEYKKSLPGLTVEPSQFAAEMSALARRGYHSVTIRGLYDALFRGRRLPPKPVVISFDDGYVDAVKQILPVLRRDRMTAVFYVITDRFHEPGFLNRTEVRRLDRAGMDIGAHTRHHVDLTRLPASEMATEIAGSRRDLERVVGHAIDSFAYPAGRYDTTVVAAVRRSGFVLAVTTDPGTLESSRRPLLLPRVRVSRDTTVSQMLACMSTPTACGGTGE
jgi:peptidoglycan/xylan/chitin deacetylase (PgdA/CDA1 family)